MRMLLASRRTLRLFPNDQHDHNNDESHDYGQPQEERPTRRANNLHN